MTKAPMADETGSETSCAVAIASGNNVESKYAPPAARKRMFLAPPTWSIHKHCTMRTNSHELCQTGHMDCTAHSIRRSHHFVARDSIAVRGCLHSSLSFQSACQ